jgi:hypothetical protein
VTIIAALKLLADLFVEGECLPRLLEVFKASPFPIECLREIRAKGHNLRVSVQGLHNLSMVTLPIV